MLPIAITSIAAVLLAAPAPIASSGPWNVEVQENTCLLSRPFGTGDDTFLVVFQPSIVRSTLDILLVTARGSNEQYQGSAIVTREPDGRKFNGTYVSLAGQGDRRITRISIEPELFADMASASALRIRTNPVQRTIAIAGYTKAAPFFEKCERELLQSWGVTEAQPAVPPIPLQPSARFFRPEDYPPEARDNMNIGRVRVILVVDTGGKVTGCHLASGAGANFDAATCRQGMLIPFKPAQDANGKAVASIYQVTVNWVLNP